MLRKQLLKQFHSSVGTRTDSMHKKEKTKQINNNKHLGTTAVSNNDITSCMAQENQLPDLTSSESLPVDRIQTTQI